MSGRSVSAYLSTASPKLHLGLLLDEQLLRIERALAARSYSAGGKTPCATSVSTSAASVAATSACVESGGQRVVVQEPERLLELAPQLSVPLT